MISSCTHTHVCAEHVRYILSQYTQFLNLGKTTQQLLFIGSVRRIPIRDHSCCGCGSSGNSNFSKRVGLCTIDTVKVYEQDLTTPIGGTQSYIGSHHVLTEWNEDGCIDLMERISQSEYERHLQTISNPCTPGISHLYCLPVFDAAIDRFMYLASTEDILAAENSHFASLRRRQCDSGSNSSGNRSGDRNIGMCGREHRLGLPYAGNFHFLLSMGQSNDCLEREERKKMQRLNKYMTKHHSRRTKSRDSIQDHWWRQWTDNDYMSFEEEEEEDLCYDVDIDDYDGDYDDNVDEISDCCGECGTMPCSASARSDQVIEFEHSEHDDSYCDDEIWWSDDETTFAMQVPTVDHSEEDRDWYLMEPQMQLNSHLSSTYRIIRSSSFPSAHHADEIFLFSGFDGIETGFQV